jgi:hypothetical protein
MRCGAVESNQIMGSVEGNSSAPKAGILIAKATILYEQFVQGVAEVQPLA